MQCKPGFIRCQQNSTFSLYFQVAISPHLLKWLLQQKDIFLLYIISLSMLPIYMPDDLTIKKV